MSYNDIIGTTGVGLILLAYCLNIFSIIHGESKIFFIMNIAGAILSCYASLLISYWPFVVLEGVWALVSIIGLGRVLLKSGRNTNG